MSDASGWVQVQNGQSLRAHRRPVRYIQYRGRPPPTDHQSVALLEEVGLGYHRPVAKVEVSVDGMASWLPATGKDELVGALQRAGERQPDPREGDGRRRGGQDHIREHPGGHHAPGGKRPDKRGRPGDVLARCLVRLEAFDRFGVASMKLGESPDLEGVQWRPYAPRLDWTLSGGDGQKTVYARYRDANGWGIGAGVRHHPPGRRPGLGLGWW